MEDNKQELISTFLEITMSNRRDFALSILKDERWNLEAAIQLFFDGGGSYGESTRLPTNSISDFDSTIVSSKNICSGWGSEDENGIDNGHIHFDYDVAVQPIGDWHSEDENEVEGQDHLNLNSTIAPTRGSDLDDVIETAEFLDHDDTEHRLESNVGTTNDFDWKEEGFNDTNLSILYRRLTCLMFHGHFHEAKVEASYLDRWLLVNVQDSEQLNSHLLNRETWLNVTVQELLRSYFIFWQIDHKDHEGQKVCCFYKLVALPTILVIDPITGAKMYACQEMKQPEDLLEDLMRFSDRSPRQLLFAGTRREDASASTDQTVEHEEATLPKETSHVSTTKPSYPPLPEEPTDKKLIYRVGICLPSGQRVQRSFLKTDLTKLLWSFCSTLLKEDEECQSFCFIVPNSPKLFYDKDTTFEEAGLSNALLRVSLEGDN